MFIYGLCDPSNGELRYIGQTSKLLRERLASHIWTAKNIKSNDHRSNWIRSLLNHNLRPEIFEIQETNSSNWKFDEQWNIEYFKSIGCRLTNSNDGGSGVTSRAGVKHKLETIEKIRNSHIGRKHSDEHIKNLSKYQNNRPKEHNKNISQSIIRGGKFAGDKNPRAKLTNQQTQEVIKKYFDLDMNGPEIAKIYNIVKESVYYIIKKEISSGRRMAKQKRRTP